MVGSTPAVPVPEVESPPRRPSRLAAWVQFPRRLVLLFLAFSTVAVLLLIVEDWLPAGQGGGSPLVARTLYRSNTLILLGASLFFALFLTLLGLLVADLINALEKKGGILGGILGALARLLGSGLLAVPTMALGIALMLIVGVGLKILPVVGMVTPGGHGGPVDVLAHLVLPAFTLAIFPALVATRAGYRHVTILREQGSLAPWRAGILQALAVLFDQTGGLIGMSVVIEMVFAWPGIGSWLVQLVLRAANPAGIIAVIILYAGGILLGRFLAELLRWLARLIDEPLPTPGVRRPRNRVWFVLALVLLLAPLGLAIAGGLVNGEVALPVDVAGRLQPASPEHPWGTDELGRDVRLGALWGALLSLQTAALASLAMLIPAGLVGALAGWLASRRTWWGESLADLLLFPADVLLFIPPLPSALLLVLLAQPLREAATDWMKQDWLWVAAILAVVLLPRALRAGQALWRSKGWPAGIAALFMSGFYAAFLVEAALDFLGLGIRPPLPTLAGELNKVFPYLAAEPGVFWRFAILLAVCALALYASADALAGLVDGKEAIARFDG